MRRADVLHAEVVHAEVPRAVVVGLDCATGVQTARVLAGRGVPVVGVVRDPRHPCARTRACERVVVGDTASDALVGVLQTLGAGFGARAVLVPCTDMSVLVASRCRDALAAAYHVLLPPADVVELLLDKARFATFAATAGLPIPPTFVLRGRDDALHAAATLRYPAVLKPAVKTPAWERRTTAKVYQAADAAELLALYDRCAAWADTLVAQEFIAGEDTDQYTCNAYFGRGGAPLVTFTTRKLRQWPVTGGQACLSVEADDAAVRDATFRVFGAAGHRGLAYLEMKRDVRTGAYLIIEPNVGRPTGRSACAEAAGVELLYTMYCDAVGLPLPERRVQAFRGVKWVYLRRDLQAALHHWRRGDLTLGAWLRSLRGPKVEALWSWRDPVPFWADLAHAARVALAGRRPRRDAAPTPAPAAP